MGICLIQCRNQKRLRERELAMKFNLTVLWTLLFCLLTNTIYASPPMKKKKFETPAAKFEGTWQVDSYDFREFVEIPNDLEKQLSDEVAAFPVGQRIRFESTGSAVLPGSIDPVTMTSPGPTGDTLNMTLLYPFVPEICKRKHWNYLCDGQSKKDVSEELMIDGVSDWTRNIPAPYAHVWDDVLKRQYSLLHMGKLYHFDARIGKNGDIFIIVTVEGLAKGKGNIPDTVGMADIGIRLKRVSN